jgi:hypothetical protein
MLDRWLEELARDEEEQTKLASVEDSFANLSTEELMKLSGLDKKALAPSTLQLPTPPPATQPGVPPVPEEPPMAPGEEMMPPEEMMPEEMGPETAGAAVAEEAAMPLAGGAPVTPGQVGAAVGSGVATVMEMMGALGAGAEQMAAEQGPPEPSPEEQAMMEQQMAEDEAAQMQPAAEQGAPPPPPPAPAPMPASNPAVGGAGGMSMPPGAGPSGAQVPGMGGMGGMGMPGMTPKMGSAPRTSPAGDRTGQSPFAEKGAEVIANALDPTVGADSVKTGSALPLDVYESAIIKTAQAEMEKEAGDWTPNPDYDASHEPTVPRNWGRPEPSPPSGGGGPRPDNIITGSWDEGPRDTAKAHGADFAAALTPFAKNPTSLPRKPKKKEGSAGTEKTAWAWPAALGAAGGLAGGIGGTLGVQKLMKERREGKIESALQQLPGPLGEFYLANPERRDEVADFMSRMPAADKKPMGTFANVQFAPISDEMIGHMEQLQKAGSAPEIYTSALQKQANPAAAAAMEQFVAKAPPRMGHARSVLGDVLNPFKHLSKRREMRDVAGHMREIGEAPMSIKALPELAGTPSSSGHLMTVGNDVMTRAQFQEMLAQRAQMVEAGLPGGAKVNLNAQQLEALLGQRHGQAQRAFGQAEELERAALREGLIGGGMLAAGPLGVIGGGAAGGALLSGMDANPSRKYDRAIERSERRADRAERKAERSQE